MSTQPNSPQLPNPLINKTINTISLISASLVTLTMLLLFLYNKKLINRVSLRLQTGIAILDILRHTIQYYIIRNNNDNTCQWIGFLLVMLNQIYYLLNVSIVLNMQLLILSGRFPNEVWEWVYWSFAVVGAFGLTLPPFALGMFGRDSLGRCLFNIEQPNSNLVNFLLININSTLTLLYCFIIPIIILYKLKYNVDAFSNLRNYLGSNQSSNNNNVFKLQLRVLVLRCMLYPLACFISLLAPSILTLYSLFGLNPTPIMLIWVTCSSCLVGLFNLIAFSFDPTIHRAISTVYYELTDRVNLNEVGLVKNDDRSKVSGDDNDSNLQMISYEGETLRNQRDNNSNLTLDNYLNYV